MSHEIKHILNKALDLQREYSAEIVVYFPRFLIRLWQDQLQEMFDLLFVLAIICFIGSTSLVS